MTIDRERNTREEMAEIHAKMDGQSSPNNKEREAETRERIKQIRSNNRSLASILTTPAIDEIMALIQSDRRQFAQQFAERVLAEGPKDVNKPMGAANFGATVNTNNAAWRATIASQLSGGEEQT